MSDRNLKPITSGRNLSDDRDPFEAFRQRMDHLFGALGGPVEARSFAPPPAARWLTLDLNETDQTYTVTAELPGIDAQDVELTLRDNTLILRGEKRDEHREGEGERVYLERSYGRFERNIPFAVQVDANGARAECRNGVLTVTLPKNPEAKSEVRRIEVRPHAS
jgi:HSP20 family protein